MGDYVILMEELLSPSRLFYIPFYEANKQEIIISNDLLTIRAEIHSKIN